MQPRDYELLARLLVASVEQDASGAVPGGREQLPQHEAGRHARRANRWKRRSAHCATAAACPTPTTMAASSYGIARFIWSLQDHRDVVCGLGAPRLVEGVIAGLWSPARARRTGPPP